VHKRRKASRPASLSSIVGVIAVVVVVAAAATTTAVPVQARAPTGDYARFNECPRFTGHVNICLYGETLHGEMALGRRELAIERPVVLQGGIEKNEQTLAETFVGALNGETLSRTPQQVPGGLLGLRVYASLELLPRPNKVEISVASLEEERGAGVVLPIRVRLENPLLGNECYIGSSGRPIVLRLTTGRTNPSPPNRPISGTFGDLSSEYGFNLIEVSRNVMVDNAFTAPEATGCGGPGRAPLLGPMIDRELGLPSPDGYNTIIEDNTLWEATAAKVIASE
jgi:hypothetical protein